MVLIFTSAIIADNSKSSTRDSLEKKDTLKYLYIIEPTITKEALSKTSNYFLDSSKISFSPGSFGDINKIIAMIPSVSSIATYNNNSLIIRGGNSSEIGYSIDNLELDNTTHFVQVENTQTGSLGIVDPRLIKSLYVHTLGSPVSFVPKISSIIDITLREGNDSIYKEEVDIGINGAGILLEGPLFKNGSNYLSLFRFSDLNFLSQFFPSYINRIKYGDAFIKLSINISNKHKIDLLSIYSFDLYEEFDRLLYSTHKLNNNSKLKSDLFTIGLSLKSVEDIFTNNLNIQCTYSDYNKKIVNKKDIDTTLKILTIDTLEQYFDSTHSLMFKGFFIVDNPLYIQFLYKSRISITDKLSMKPADNLNLSIGCFLNIEEYKTCLKYNLIDIMRQINERDLSNFIHFDYNSVVNNLYERDADNLYENEYLRYIPGMYFQFMGQIRNFLILAGARGSYENFSKSILNILNFSLRGKINQSNIISLGCNYTNQIHSNLIELLFNKHNPIDISKLELQKCLQSAIEYSTDIKENFSGNLSIYTKYYNHEFLYKTPEEYEYDFIKDTSNNNLLYHVQEPNGHKIAAGIECQILYSYKEKLEGCLSLTTSATYNEYTKDKFFYNQNGFFRKAYLSLIYRINNNHIFSAYLKIQNGQINPDILYNPKTKKYSYDINNSSFDSNYFDPIIELSCRYNYHLDFKKLELNFFIDLYNILNQTPIINKELSSGNLLYNKLNGFVPTLGIRISF
jgi:hypothetical protein